MTTRREHVLDVLQGLRDFGALVAVVLVVIAEFQLADERDSRRGQVNDAVCSIVKAIPPGNRQIDTTRDRFHCGPYVPPGIVPQPGRTRPGRTRTATVTPSPTTGALGPPDGVPVTPTPGGRTPTPSRVVTRTRVVTPPTRTHTTTVSRTVTPPPPSSGGVLAPICKLLPLPLVCPTANAVQSG